QVAFMACSSGTGDRPHRWLAPRLRPRSPSCTARATGRCPLGFPRLGRNRRCSGRTRHDGPWRAGHGHASSRTPSTSRGLHLLAVIRDVVVGVEPPEERLEIIGGESTLGESPTGFVELDPFSSKYVDRVAGVTGIVPSEAFANPPVEREDPICLGQRGIGDDVIADCLGSGPSQDRKSTRLNSSHVKISYAVFCLKE